MKKSLSIVILLALIPICSALRGEDTVDPDTLIAHVKERIAYLEKLYEQGVEIEREGIKLEGTKDDDDDPDKRTVSRTVYYGLYEMAQNTHFSKSSGEMTSEYREVRNPKYSFVVNKEKGNSQYKVGEQWNNRDGILIDQNNNGLLDDSPATLAGLFLCELRLRDLFDSETFKVESVDKRENQYRLAFRSHIFMDKCSCVLGGELFFNKEDYSLEETNLDGEFFIIDDRTFLFNRKTKYIYGDWDGIKYPKQIESRFDGYDIKVHSLSTINSFRLGAPNKKEFYLKYYGIPEPKSPRRLPTKVIFMIVGVLLIGLGVYLKIRATGKQKAL